MNKSTQNLYTRLNSFG